jgi:serine/threonine-protein kinase
MSQLDFQRYDLVEQIAAGGMGEVFVGHVRGEHGFLKMVAVKRIRRELASSPDFVVRFVAEAKLAVQLSHANVVQVFDLGRVGDDLLLVMEYVHGADLRQLLGSLRRLGQRMPVPIAVYAAMEALKGLVCAHEAGVIHCDISPSNLLLSYAGEVKIADFGVAQAFHVASRAHRGDHPIMGKLRYMAPEQLRGAGLDARADLYSLAVVLHETLSMQPLFSGDGAERDAPIPRLAELRDDVPEALDDLIVRALAEEPAARPAGAREMLGELTRIAYALDPVTAPEVGGWVRELEPPRSQTRTPTNFDRALRQLIGGGERPTGTLTAVPDARPTAAFEVHKTDDGSTVWKAVELEPQGGRRLPRKLAMAIALVAAAWIASAAALQTGRVRASSAAAVMLPADVRSAPSVASSSPPPSLPEPAPLVTPPAPAPTAPLASVPKDVRASARRAAKHGWLSVYTEPWAYVSVDGRRIGSTPLMKQSLAAGVHRVRLERAGVRAREQQVRVHAGQTALVDLNLQPKDRSK